MELQFSSLDEFAAGLTDLREAGGLSLREVTHRVQRIRNRRKNTKAVVLSTVHHVFQAGRKRLDVDLLADIVLAITDSPAQAAAWRSAYLAIGRPESTAGTVTVRDQPPETAGPFVGRDRERAALRKVTDRRRAAVVVTGMPGVGKTRLVAEAVRAATLARPDTKVIWIDLHGYDRGRPPADPHAALGAALAALEVPGDVIHVLSLPQRARKYRQLLAGRSAIVVLDNARDEAQVKPLLASGPGCCTLITARRHLRDLPAAATLEVDVLTEPDARALFELSAGRDRMDAEPGAVRRILDRCGYLPLDLTIALARIARQDDWTLADHADRLEQFPVTDEVRPILGTSYQALPARLQQTFCLLALHPGPDFSAPVAAALLDTDPATGADVIDQLEAESLIQPGRPGRYRFHDVVGAFARHMLQQDVAASRQRAAADRDARYFLAAASAAMDGAAPFEKESRPPIDPAASPCPACPPATRPWPGSTRNATRCSRSDWRGGRRARPTGPRCWRPPSGAISTPATGMTRPPSFVRGR